MSKRSSWDIVSRGFGVLNFIKDYWLFIFPILTLAGQFLGTAIPWPYFFGLFAVVTATTIWSLSQYRILLANRSPEKKFSVYLDNVSQSLDMERKGKYKYQLFFTINNSYDRPLFVCVNELVWDIAQKAHSVSDAIQTRFMFAPGIRSITSSTIGGLKAGLFHNGTFKMKLGLGENFGEQTMELTIIGNFKLSASTKNKHQTFLMSSTKITEYSFEKID